MTEPVSGSKKQEDHMVIAVPIVEGKLCMHFGHCAQFALVEVDLESKKVIGRKDIPAPPHQPGLLPPWLADQGAKLVIAGGMGARAQALFVDRGIQVISGAPAFSPEDIATAWMNGTLAVGQNQCDH